MAPDHREFWTPWFILMVSSINNPNHCTINIRKHQKFTYEHSLKLQSSYTVLWIAPYVAVGAIEPSVSFAKKKKKKGKFDFIRPYCITCWLHVRCFLTWNFFAVVGNCLFSTLILFGTFQMFIPFAIVDIGKQVRMDLHSLTAAIPVGFVTDFYRQDVTP